MSCLPWRSYPDSQVLTTIENGLAAPPLSPTKTRKVLLDHLIDGVLRVQDDGFHHVLSMVTHVHAHLSDKSIDLKGSLLRFLHSF